MKRIFIALLMSALFVNADAQRKNEVYLTLSPMKLNGSVSGYSQTESTNLVGFSLGYNRTFDLDETSNLKFVLGGRFHYCAKELEVDETVVNSATEQYFKVQVPVALKYVADINENVSLEPYAGLYLSFCDDASVELKKGSTTANVNLFGEIPDLKRFEAGCHIGFDLCIKRVAIGLGYNKAFTDFYSKNGVEVDWSGFDIKIGYRF